MDIAKKINVYKLAEDNFIYPEDLVVMANENTGDIEVNLLYSLYHVESETLSESSVSFSLEKMLRQFYIRSKLSGEHVDKNVEEIIKLLTEQQA